MEEPKQISDPMYATVNAILENDNVVIPHLLESREVIKAKMCISALMIKSKPNRISRGRISYYRTSDSSDKAKSMGLK